MNPKIRRVAFFAASFNPVHEAQMNIPSALQMFVLMNVHFFTQIFVWTADNPLKRDKNNKYYDPYYLDKNTRQTMVDLAFDSFFTDEQKKSIMIANHLDACFSGVSVVEYLVENDLDIENPCDEYDHEFNGMLRRYKKKNDDGYLYEVWIVYGEDTANGINSWSSKLGNSLLAKYVTGMIMIPRDINSPNDQIINHGTYYDMPTLPTLYVPSLKTDFVGTDDDFHFTIKGLKETNNKHYHVMDDDIVEKLNLKNFRMTYKESFIPTIVYRINGLSSTSSSAVRMLCGVYHYSCNDKTDQETQKVLSALRSFQEKKKDDYNNILTRLNINNPDAINVLNVDSDILKNILENMVSKNVFAYIVENKLFAI